MLKIDRPIIVEGKYDKIKLSSFIDGTIIDIGGFSFFSNKEKKEFIKKLAEKKGIIVLTDSDSAGFKIRNFIRSIAGDENITNVYIPDVYGKEKRKDKWSAEGKLGVEGIDEKTLSECLKKAGLVSDNSDCPEKFENGRKLTPSDLFSDSVTGSPNSADLRKRLLKNLGLPEHLSANQMIKFINSYLSYDEYAEALKKAKSDF